MIRAENNPRCSCLQDLFICFFFFYTCRRLSVSAGQKKKTKKNPAISLWPVCRFRCFKNISSSHTEMANPREKRYWILIMHTTSLHYQSKQWNASGQIVYLDNQSHEKWGSFFSATVRFVFLKYHRTPFLSFVFPFFFFWISGYTLRLVYGKINSSERDLGLLFLLFQKTHIITEQMGHDGGSFSNV